MIYSNYQNCVNVVSPKVSYCTAVVDSWPQLYWKPQKVKSQMGRREGTTVMVLNHIFKLNTSSTDPFVKQKKQMWTSDQDTELQPTAHFWIKVYLVAQEEKKQN